LAKNSPSPIVKVAGKYGFIGGLVLTATLIILFYLGKHPLFLIPLVFDLRILLFALFITLAIREFKETNDSVLHFWQGLTIGLICYILISFLTAIFLLIFGGLIDPSFVSEYIQLSIDNLNANRDVFEETIGSEVLDNAIENLPSTTANDLAFDYFLKSTPIGFILTLGISLMLRKQPK